MMEMHMDDMECHHAECFEGDLQETYLEGREEGDFTIEQSQRATAIYHARSVLEKRGGIAFAASASSTPPNVNDLITVAEWIMTGRSWEE